MPATTVAAAGGYSYSVHADLRHGPPPCCLHFLPVVPKCPIVLFSGALHRKQKCCVHDQHCTWLLLLIRKMCARQYGHGFATPPMPSRRCTSCTSAPAFTGRTRPAPISRSHAAMAASSNSAHEAAPKWS